MESISSGGSPVRNLAAMVSKYNCRHSRAKSDFASWERADGRMGRMLECQSRQVPMKSKRTALICPLRLVGSVDIVVFVSSLV